MKIRITRDLYDIASRVCEIDPSYEVYFETELQKFTLWAKGKRQLVFPFENLDARAVEYTRETGTNRLDEIVKELDAKNERYEKERVAIVCDKVENEFSRRMRLAGE